MATQGVPVVAFIKNKQWWEVQQPMQASLEKFRFGVRGILQLILHKYKVYYRGGSVYLV